MEKSRRFTWIFFSVQIALALSILFFLETAMPEGFLGLSGGTLARVAIALTVVPVGYIYGRNSARKDEIGWLARILLPLSVVAIVFGYFVGGEWAILSAFGIGFLAGFIPGWMIQTRAREKYGNSIEADQVMNVVISEHLPSPASNCKEYLKVQDSTTRSLIRRLLFTRFLIFITFKGVVTWLIVADTFGDLSRLIFTRPGDGSLFFITSSPLQIALPLIILSTIMSTLVSSRVLPMLAGERYEKWYEYAVLEYKEKNHTVTSNHFQKLLRAVVSTFLFASFLLYLDSYVKISSEGIEVNRYWEVGGTFYPWSEIRDVDYHYDSYICDDCGGEHKSFQAKVTFTDGTEWNPDTAYKEEQIANAIRYVAERTGLATIDSPWPPPPPGMEPPGPLILDGEMPPSPSPGMDHPGHPSLEGEMPPPPTPGFDFPVPPSPGEGVPPPP